MSSMLAFDAAFYGGDWPKRQWQARRWCSGDGKWTRWQNCTAEQKAEWEKRSDFEFREAPSKKKKS